MRGDGFRLPAALLAALALLLLAVPARAGDPYLRWYTINTPHFHVHFHGGLEPVAQRTANLLEDEYNILVPELGWAPDITEVLLTDATDDANGSSGALPYDEIRLFVTAPDDMSPLGDYDDWLRELTTHELTHTVHIDNISGIPAVVNSILGKTVAPNQAQPRWVLEGLAVTMETEHTSGGRLRLSQWDMYMRADTLSHNLARLDQISNDARRWPSGNLWYLYGSEFVEWIEHIYGPNTFAAIATDYGANIVPWGINRSVRRVTGRTYEQLYRGWEKHLEEKYRAQAAAVRRRGLRQGAQLTHRGRVAYSPRFVPQCARSGSREEVYYVADDGDRTAGVYRVPLISRGRADESNEQIITRMSGTGLAFDSDCGIVFDSTAPTKRQYYFTDLFRQPHGTRAPRGLDRSRRRLTVSRRARTPDVSRDGRHIAYVTNHAGTSTLRIADFTADHRITHQRTLVPSARYEQAFTPRFSPDGHKVAYSAWTHGGYRDIRIVDVKTGRFYEIAHDRALDQQPTWSADGRTVYFTSDRTGIANVYAYDVASHKLSQVTNVIMGAYMPEVTPDGRTLFYVGYTSAGFDLFSMPLDRSRFLPALPYIDHRPATPPEQYDKRWPVENYNPLPTLRPHAYQLKYGPGTFGQALTVSTTGEDAVGLHSFSASITVETQQGEPSVRLGYAYHRLPFAFRASVFRSSSPRTGFRYGDQTPIITEHLTGATTGVSYPILGEFDAASVALNYTIAKFDSVLPIGPIADPYSQVTRVPDRGYLGMLHIGGSYSNAESTADAISLEKGFTLVAGADIAARALGSDSTLTAFSARVSGYIPMPWARHHVLALALAGAAAVGTYPRRGLYYTGGFGDQPVIDAYTNGIDQGPFVLRGYAPVQFIGSQYNLLNTEYRFPIAYADRGLSTLPVFLRTLSGAVFADYGGAFNQLDLADPLKSYHLGVGAELWIDLELGYFARANLRLGYAHGVDDSKAIPGGQVYFVASSPF